jgi:hypothetical protein
MAAAVENWSEIEISDAEVDEIIEEAGDDPRQAIRRQNSGRCWTDWMIVRGKAHAQSPMRRRPASFSQF